MERVICANATNADLTVTGLVRSAKVMTDQSNTNLTRGALGVEVRTAKTFMKAIGFAFGLFCLLMAYVSGIRLYKHLLVDQSVGSQGGASLALDIGGNLLLLVMSILGLITVMLVARKGLDNLIRHWPYVAPGILIAVFWATMAATLGARRMTWVLPVAGFAALVGLWAGWSVLRRHRLPITARVSDIPATREQNEARH
jgi:hypothetical protein